MPNALPLELVTFYEEGSEHLTARSVVVQLDHDLPSAASLMPDPGATLVESPILRLRRDVEQLDQLPARKKK